MEKSVLLPFGILSKMVGVFYSPAPNVVKRPLNTTSLLSLLSLVLSGVGYDIVAVVVDFVTHVACASFPDLNKYLFETFCHLFCPVG